MWKFRPAKSTNNEELLGNFNSWFNVEDENFKSLDEVGKILDLLADLLPNFAGMV